MRISLVGMSGVGKSYWSKQLEGQGFVRYCCDDLIEERLASVLIKADGTRMNMGEWMGFPFEKGFREREALYLKYEKEVMNWVLDELERASHNGQMKDIVIDTTGSVIYTGDEILERLKMQTRIVYFSTPPDVQDKMFSAFVQRPTPMVWLDTYDKKEGESGMDAMRRCYPLLLSKRERLYSQYADVTIDYRVERGQDFSVEDLLIHIFRDSH